VGARERERPVQTTVLVDVLEAGDRVRPDEAEQLVARERCADREPDDDGPGLDRLPRSRSSAAQIGG
jgi:hypothetical protein